MTGLDGPPILFVDLDGTVRHGFDELGRFVNSPDDVVIFPEAIERMGAWHDDTGGVVIGVTNQGGVGLGYITEQTHRDIMATTLRLAGLDHVLACTHAPAVACWCRKPLAGLLWQAVAWVNAVRLTLPDRLDCLMVGDRPEDEQAAVAAGVRFQWAVAWRAGAQ